MNRFSTFFSFSFIQISFFLIFFFWIFKIKKVVISHNIYSFVYNTTGYDIRPAEYQANETGYPTGHRIQKRLDIRYNPMKTPFKNISRWVFILLCWQCKLTRTCLSIFCPGLLLKKLISLTWTILIIPYVLCIMPY